MDNRPVGIFDSGLGGLTAVKALRELMPGEDIVYFADSARVPYGIRTPGEIRIMARQNMEFLKALGVKAILAACGTVSSNAADTLEDFPLPVFGVIKAAVRAAAGAAGDTALGLIATPASIINGAYERALKELCPERRVISVPCPDFVTLIEGGHSRSDDALLAAAVEKYISPLKSAGVGAVLLGCTHFGIISDAILNYMGRDTVLVSAAECAAAELADYMREKGLASGRRSIGTLQCYTSGSADEFYSPASQFLGRAPDEYPKHVPVMEV